MSRIAHADGTVEGSPSGGRGQAAPGGRKARRNVVANIALSDADGVAPGGSAPEAAPPAPAAAGAAAAAGGGSGGGGGGARRAAEGGGGARPTGGTLACRTKVVGEGR
jgi:hypothetical protein